jgi:hypothetical protein
MRISNDDDTFEPSSGLPKAYRGITLDSLKAAPKSQGKKLPDNLLYKTKLRASTAERFVVSTCTFISKPCPIDMIIKSDLSIP